MAYHSIFYGRQYNHGIIGLQNADESGNVIFHPKDYLDPVLFSFRPKNFYGKKKAAIRIEFGEWSDKFSLDVPGSSGVVTCTLDGRIYQVSFFIILG